MEREVELREGNISLVLDSYDDLFSDFDPRDYSQKALSDDFLDECRRAARDKDAGVELRLLIPKKKRNLKDEEEIKKRMRNHFQKHFREKETEIKGVKKQGALWFALGTIFILSAAYFYSKEGYFFNVLVVLLEPAGWFSFWEGLGKILIVSKEKNPDYEFYKKMNNAEITFNNY
ncbi:hypothetical protein J4405_04375 [Candidatus Woesearchaeota archaeon]|nr:hypothetical protein [Candidatus Woesearchaeota archaeon]